MIKYRDIFWDFSNTNNNINSNDPNMDTDINNIEIRNDQSMKKASAWYYCAYIAQTEYDNLFLAGDWTATGYPATIEGAIMSGQKAARLAANK